MVDNDVQVKFGASIGELLDGVDEAKGAIEGLGESFATLAEFAGITFGIGALKEFVASQAELGEQTERTSKILGLSTEQVGELQYAFAATGTSSGNLDMMMGRFEVTLARAAQGIGPAAAGMKALGLNAKDLVGIPFPEQLEKMADAVSRFADGTNKSAALQTFGRGFVELIPLLDQGSAGFDAMSATADKTNSVLSEMATSRLVDLEHGLVESAAAIKGIGVEAFAPFITEVTSGVGQITQLAEAISNSAKSGGVLTGVLGEASDALRLLLSATEIGVGLFIQMMDAGDTAFLTLNDGAQDFGIVVKDVFSALGAALPDFFTGLLTAGHEAVLAVEQQFLDLGTVIGDTLKLNFAGAREAFDTMGTDLSASMGKIKGSFSGGFDFSQTEADAKRASNHIAGDLKEGGDKMVADAKASTAQLDQLWKAAISQAPEIDMLGGKKQAPNIDTNAIAEAAAAAKKAESAFNDELKAAQNAETLIETGLNNRLKLHQITMQTWLTDSEHALEAEALAVTNANTQAAASTALSSDQKKAIWQKEQDELTAISKKEADDQAKAAEQAAASWKSLGDTTAGILNSQVDGVLKGTTSIKQAFTNMAASAVEDVVKMCVKWAAEHAATVAMNMAGNSAELAGLLSMFGLQTAAQASAAATQAATAQAAKAPIIASDVGQAAAGMAAFLAPTLGPAALPAGIAFGAQVGVIGAADVGAYDVPEDQLMMIHKNEMVATPSQAEGIRSLAENGGQGNGGSSGGDTHFHFSPQVQAFDSTGVQSVLSQYGAAFAKSVANLQTQRPSLRGGF